MVSSSMLFLTHPTVRLGQQTTVWPAHGMGFCKYVALHLASRTMFIGYIDRIHVEFGKWLVDKSNDVILFSFSVAVSHRYMINRIWNSETGRLETGKNMMAGTRRVCCSSLPGDFLSKFLSTANDLLRVGRWGLREFHFSGFCNSNSANDLFPSAFIET